MYFRALRVGAGCQTGRAHIGVEVPVGRRAGVLVQHRSHTIYRLGGYRAPWQHIDFFRCISPPHLTHPESGVWISRIESSDISKYRTSDISYPIERVFCIIPWDSPLFFYAGAERKTFMCTQNIELNIPNPCGTERRGSYVLYKISKPHP